jgi:chromosome segregation ATPase
VSEEKSIAERLAGLEAQQSSIQRTLDEMKMSMAKMTDAFTRYMTAAATVDARLLAIEQDLRDGRSMFKAHDEAISSIKQKCDQNEGLRLDGKRHLEAAGEQEKQVGIATNMAAWAERAVWALLVAIIGLIAYFR